MHLSVAGVSHRSAPIAIREQLHLTPEATRQLVREVVRSGEEVAILSTCNRTEWYVLDRDGSTSRRIRARLTGDDPTFQPYLYYYEGAAVARHLFRVAGGLDSLVLGEAQILGQVREAFELAREAGTVGPILEQLGRKALEAGKRIRSETGIGRGTASISSAAVHLARAIFPDLAGSQVLVLGAGEMATLTARHLREQGARAVIVANRNRHRAQQVAAACGGRAAGFDELEPLLVASDIVISSTAAPHAVIRRELLERILPARRGRPLYIIDIAVPRDVEVACGELEGVTLHNIDDLEQVVAANLTQREAHLEAAERVVEETVAEFVAWWRSRAAAPLIRALFDHAAAIREAEVARALRRLGELDPRQREVVEAMASAIVNKLLHRPVTRLKAALAHGDGRAYLQSLQDLFGLELPPGGEPGPEVQPAGPPGEGRPPRQGAGDAWPEQTGPDPFGRQEVGRHEGKAVG
ncbi:glutamyl-tRNA reductase [Limnochorda pilosa]|uniref:glutamyl-tRNA reductase n=1 Tax=Limnochorda pilosa TaxID=1555112 RepID=UPI0026EB2BDD|nr:glutamyl-tRNA reductase [Limnochorda pilosa]